MNDIHSSIATLQSKRFIGFRCHYIMPKSGFTHKRSHFTQAHIRLPGLPTIVHSEQKMENLSVRSG